MDEGIDPIAFLGMLDVAYENAGPIAGLVLVYSADVRTDQNAG
jgi:hypothetical protein